MDEARDRERLLDIWLGLSGQAPLPEGPLIMPVLSGSMRPVMPLGAHLLIKPCRAADCRRGQVAVHTAGERLVAHRVLLFLGPRSWGWALLKGDANPHASWCRNRHIKGIVHRVLPAEDPQGQTGGTDPFSTDAASVSGRQYARNLVLAVPRRVRDWLFRRDKKNRGGP